MKKHILGTDEPTLVKIERYFNKEYGIAVEQLKDNTNVIKMIRERVWSSWSEEIKSDCLRELWDYIVRAENYDIDIFSEFYIYIKLCTAEWERADNMNDVMDRLENGDMDKKFYSEDIIKNFPLKIEKEKAGGKTVWKRKKFGEDFTKTLICEKYNKRIFDMTGDDISRYGYRKGEKIYEELKMSSFENI